MEAPPSKEPGAVAQGTRKTLWPGLAALACILLSVHLHQLYGRLHWPGSNPAATRTAILDILHLDSMFLAALSVVLAAYGLIKGHRILGLLALALSIGAVMNSLICF